MIETSGDKYSLVMFTLQVNKKLIPTHSITSKLSNAEIVDSLLFLFHPFNYFFIILNDDGL
jgi:hypothetical protein